MPASRIFAIVMLFAVTAFAFGSHSESHAGMHLHSRTHSVHHRSTYQRHPRSREVTRVFQRSHPCPPVRNLSSL
jgi:hypothetical protein